MDQIKTSRAMNITLSDFCKNHNVQNKGGSFKKGALFKSLKGDSSSLTSWFQFYKIIVKEKGFKESISKKYWKEVFREFDHYDINEWKEHLTVSATINPNNDFFNGSLESLDDIQNHPNIKLEKNGIHSMFHFHFEDIPNWGYSTFITTNKSPKYKKTLTKDIMSSSLLMGYFHDHGFERVYVAPTFAPGGLQAQLNNEISGIIPCFECGQAIIYDYEKSNQF